MEAEQYFEKLEGELTDEQMARFLTGNGDTAIEETPALDTEEVKEEEQKEEVKPVILAKDGVHTIEYEKLVEARNDAKAAKEEVESLRNTLAEREALLESLKAAKEQDAATGTTEATDSLRESVKEDFPELLELMEHSNASVVKELRAEMAELKKQISADLAPVMKTTNDTIAEKHFGTIRDAHKDFDDIMAAPEIMEWVDKHPGPIKAAYMNIIEHGTAKDVIDMVTAFKDAHPAPVGDTTDTVAMKAAEAEKKATGKSVPKSLSDIPAGTAAHHDEAGAMQNMTPVQLMNKFVGKSPNEIMEFLDRTIR